MPPTPTPVVDTPAYVFRGHAAAVHVVRIIRNNLFLLTGDADGWVVVWDLLTRRPVVVWRAHKTALLGAAEWGADKIITHGRDSRLCAWAFTAEDVRPDTYSTVLPANEKSWDETRPGPELLHCLTVNTLNFCPFGMCQVQMQSTGGLSQHPNDPDSCGEVAKLDREASGHSTSLNESIFVAVPSTQESQVDIYHLPSEQWVARIPKPSDSSAGIIMQVHLHEHRILGPLKPGEVVPLIAVIGYEHGAVSAFIGYRTELSPTTTTTTTTTTAVSGQEGAKKENLGLKWTWTWREEYTSKAHGAPVLGLAVSARSNRFFSSGADNVVAIHRLPQPRSFVVSLPAPVPTTVTKAKTETTAERKTAANRPSLLSEAFRAAGSQDISPHNPAASSQPVPSLGRFTLTPSEPVGRIVTHAVGQQDLCLDRHDGRFVVTAGWDGLVHAYAATVTETETETTTTTTAAETGTAPPRLLTHVTDFEARSLSNGLDADDGGGGWSKPAPASALARNPENPGRTNGFLTVSLSRPVLDGSGQGCDSGDGNGTDGDGGVVQGRMPRMSIRDRHRDKLQRRNWVVAGSKDGRVVMWEIPDEMLSRRS